MKVRNIGSNQTEINKDNGVSVLVSYQTPVAAFVPGRGYIQTNEHYSRTTSKHINAWAGKSAVKVSQAEINALLG